LTGNGLGIGLWNPFQPSKVLHLRSLTYDSKTSRIMQERVKKELVTKGAPILVFTHVPITGDVREYLVAITKVGSTFMNTNVENIQRLCRQNEEKESRIRELEKEFNV
jgi:hypothetical protein